MLQSLLPTRERLARLGKVPTPFCLYCPDQMDNMEHLLNCMNTDEVSSPLLRCLANQVDNIAPEDIVKLNINTTEGMELPLVWLMTTCLMYIWKERTTCKQAKLVNFMAELLARLSLLRQTKWRHYTLHNSAVLLDKMINLHFC